MFLTSKEIYLSKSLFCLFSNNSKNLIKLETVKNIHKKKYKKKNKKIFE